jgi:GNAT superfamily N-acetyltransferase
MSLKSTRRVELLTFTPETTTFDDVPNGQRLIEELCLSIYKREIMNPDADDDLHLRFNRIEHANAQIQRTEFMQRYGLGECFFVLDPDRKNTPVGFIMVQPIDGSGKPFEIGRFFLEEERSNHFGRHALTKVEGILRDWGATDVIAVRDVTNFASHKSLSSLGYHAGEPTQTDRLMEFPSGKLVKHTKPLNASPG